jgi:hypothetical protein
MPTVVSIIGLLVGITGLLMLLLGIGVISPTTLNIPGINLNVQTATPGIVVMVIGFTVALVPIVLSFWAYAKLGVAQAKVGDTPDKDPPHFLMPMQP